MPNCSSSSRLASTRRPAPTIVFSCSLIDSRPGASVLRISGHGAKRLFAGEPGGHRWQRVPPTERHGRYHTSTVTVAVLEEPEPAQLVLKPQELQWRTCRGSGAGGQHRNVTDSAVQLTHRDSGLSVRVESERSQTQNKAAALALLRAKLLQRREDAQREARWQEVREQVGSGMRGDKVRTIRLRDNSVRDHRTGKKIALKAFLRGELEGLRK
jgi:peptide chain release factor 1